MIGVLGLGQMGVPIAERLLVAGHSLVVHNRTAAKGADLLAAGAAWARAPGDLLAEADVCITVVADDAALEAVSSDILAGARAGTTLVDMSTVSPGCSRRVAEAADAAGVAYLRAPTSGNPSVVRAGNLTIIVSGPRERYDALAPVLHAIGPHLYHVGEGEEARIAKLALNLILAGTAELMAEAIVLAELQGLEPAVLLDVMGGSAVGSPFVKYKTEPLLRGDYSATFTTDMMLKDMRLVGAGAQEAGIELPLADLLADLLERTAAAGFANDDFMALLPRLRADGGTTHRTEEG